MNQQEKFDPRRSNAIREILIETVEATESTARRPRRRTLIAMAVAVVAAVLASGSIALALGGQTWFGAAEPTTTPSYTQTASPTPTPTPTTSTPVAPLQSAAPQSIIPIDCATLLPPGTLGSPMDGVTLGVDSVEPFTPQYASALQSGVLQCQWTAISDPGGMITLYVSANPDPASADVKRMLAGGSQPLGVGDASAVLCDDMSSCEASVVVGTYSLNYSVRLFSQSSDGQTLAATKQAGASYTSALQQHPTPLPAWVPPASPWASSVDCAAITPGVPMGQILGSPGMVGPTVLNPGVNPSIVQAATVGPLCRWGVPDGVTVADGQIGSLDVSLAPGTGWVSADSAFKDVEPIPVQVVGADSAELRCSYAEGETCWLDVFVDNSWLQLGYGNGFVAAGQQSLIDAATAIIATRSGG